MISDPLSQAYAVRAARLGTNARVLTLQLAGGGGESTDETAEMIDDVELLQPMGLFVRPFITPRTEVFGFELGDEVIATHMLDKSGGGGASPAAFNDVDAGETRLYGAKEAASRVRLRADGSLDVEAKANQAIRITQAEAKVWINGNGSIDIEAKAGQTLRITHPSGAKLWINGDGSVDVRSATGTAVNVAAGGAGDVVLNGGTKKVAREEDTLNVGTLVATAGPYPVVFAYVQGTVGAVPPAPPGGVSLRGVITTGTGAPRTKG